MTIAGLLAFIKRFPELLQTQDIRGRKVLVELRSFTYWIHGEFSNMHYGGEYYHVGQVVKGFLRLLHHYEVEPYFIGSVGAREDMSDAETTKYTIAKNTAYSSNFERYMTENVTLPYERVWSLLFIDSVVEALEEGGVPIEIVESDEDILPYIVHRANKDGRILLAHRADYIMSNLKEGLISLQHWQVCKDDLLNDNLLRSEKLNLPMFLRSKIIEKFGISEALIPAFVALAGTGIHKPLSPRHLLEYHKTLMMEVPDNADPRKLRSKVFIALFSFLAHSNFTCTADVIHDAEIRAPKAIRKLQSELLERARIFEDWSIEELNSAFPSLAVALQKHKYPTFSSYWTYCGSLCKFTFVGQLEDADLPYADGISSKIRKVVYEIRKQQIMDFEVEEVFRSGIDVIHANMEFKGKVTVPDGRSEKRNFILDVLGLSELSIDTHPEQEQLYILSLCYWGREGNGRHISKVHLVSMLLCAIYCSAKSYSEVLQMDLDHGHRAEIIEELEEFLRPIDHERLCFDIRISHAFAQWQCCWRDLKWLNDTLGQPFNDCYVHKLYYGSFLYYVAAVQLAGGRIDHIIDVVQPHYSRLIADTAIYFTNSPAPGEYDFTRRPRQARICKRFKAVVCPSQQTCKGVDCVRLHICPGRLRNKCFKRPCHLNHDIHDRQPSMVLSYLGVTATGEELIRLINRGVL